MQLHKNNTLCHLVPLTQNTRTAGILNAINESYKYVYLSSSFVQIKRIILSHKDGSTFFSHLNKLKKNDISIPARTFTDASFLQQWKLPSLSRWRRAIKRGESMWRRGDKATLTDRGERLHGNWIAEAPHILWQKKAEEWKEVEQREERQRKERGTPEDSCRSARRARQNGVSVT